MAIEKLASTDSFLRWKLPLSALDIPPAVAFGKDQKGSSRPASKYFRSHQGLHLTQALYNTVHPHLEAQPVKIAQTAIIIWELTQTGINFGRAVYSTDAKKNPVPWWIIDPLLVWQQRGEEKTVLASQGETYFFMPYCQDKSAMSQAVKADLKRGFHTEWWFDTLDKPDTVLCSPGQVFISVV